MASRTRWPTITSTEAAQIIFGDTFYNDYLYWQQNAADIDQIQFYKSCEDWQSSIQSLQDVAPGETPTWASFKYFMNWLRLNGKLYPKADQFPTSTLAVAWGCRHLIHPGNPRQDVSTCPVCIMSSCVESLVRIADAWEKIWGGPVTKEFRGACKPPPLYYKVKQIWHVEKLRFANLVSVYEHHVEEEQHWEEESLHLFDHSFEDLVNAKSCAEALQIAREQCPYMASGADVPFAKGDSFPGIKGGSVAQGAEGEASNLSLRSLSTPESASSPYSTQGPLVESPRPHLPLRSLESPSSASFSDFHQPPLPPPLSSHPTTTSRDQIPDMGKTKKVAFAEDCVEHASRKMSHFHRTSRLYTPGRHECPSEDGWEDSSFCNAPGNQPKPSISLSRLDASLESTHRLILTY
ncbi:hypothetical protein K505DRAFT_84635 [Melanomma pulvis-pyrius CBS 109.77]|uniref:Uncharacterized protein n=1 Tax=Melanomma pulvis-pyrius CBS 109.77 TaxID=1314802 RepID=A0A6A6X2F1_9PLEO|nr:hypothetical protein K505DRAFT_84635 [Melanomma pulvis-pyrius CBS 109.77]